MALSALVAHALAGTWSEPLTALRERGGLLVASVLTAILLVGAFFALSRALPRTVALLFIPAAWGLQALCRSLAERALPPGLRPVLVLGSGEDARRAAAALKAGEVPGYRLLAWEADAVAAIAEGDGQGALCGAEDVVLASGNAREREAFTALVERSAAGGFELWLLPGMAHVVASHVATRSLGDLPLTPVEARGASSAAFALRRVIDLAVGLPLAVAAAIPVRPASPSSSSSRRGGRRGSASGASGVGGASSTSGRSGTMRADAEAETGPVLAKPGTMDA